MRKLTKFNGGVDLFTKICINFAVQKIQKALGKPQFKVKEIPEAPLCEKGRFFNFRLVNFTLFFYENSFYMIIFNFFI